jgi:hypothetical protein
LPSAGGYGATQTSLNPVGRQRFHCRERSIEGTANWDGDVSDHRARRMAAGRVEFADEEIDRALIDA